MNEKDIRFLAEFPAVSDEAWEAQILADLKGKDYEKSLIWKTGEGIKVKPYYRSGDIRDLGITRSVPGKFPYVRGKYASGNPWLTRQDIVVTDPVSANRKALEILQKGVDSLGFVINNCQVPSSKDLDILLRDVCLEAIEVNFVLCCRNGEFISTLAGWLHETDMDPATVRMSVNHDPIGRFTLHGSFVRPENEIFEKVGKTLEAGMKFPNMQLISVHGIHFCNAGASVVQELGFSLAMGAEYLARLTGLGYDANQVATKTRFNFGIGSNYFMELAKLRAARLLWAHIVRSFVSDAGNRETGTEGCRMQIHCETSSWNKTLYDPYVNMLRTQTEAMSAVLGGTDSLTVLPYDSVYGPASSFGERIARNQQALLREEVHLDKIADPAAGSYYIETLTASVAAEAWKLFVQVQGKGGFLAAFREGFVQSLVSSSAARRSQAIAMRRENVLGVNQFPNVGEQITVPLDPSLFEQTDLAEPDAEVETLKLFRGAMQLEAVRYATDRFAATGTRPRVLMLPLGNPAMRKARSQFSCNFFAAAGYEVTDHNGFDSVSEAMAFVEDQKPEMVVLCSSDEEYATLAPEVFGALGGRAILVIAGAPECAAELKEQGIVNFISLRTNLLEALTEYNRKLGIA